MSRKIRDSMLAGMSVARSATADLVHAIERERERERRPAGQAGAMACGPYRRGWFDLADGREPRPVAGWTRGEDWNGYACPSFELPAGLALARAITDGALRYDLEADVFVWTGDGEAPEITVPSEVQTPEGMRKVYEIGEGRCWEEWPEPVS